MELRRDLSIAKDSENSEDDITSCSWVSKREPKCGGEGQIM